MPGQSPMPGPGPLDLLDEVNSVAFGLPCTLVPSIRNLLVVVIFDNSAGWPGEIRMNTGTWGALVSIQAVGGRDWAKVVHHVQTAISYCEQDQTSKTCDLGVLNLKPPSPKPSPRRKSDRLSTVSEGIGNLVAQIAPLCDGRSLDDETVMAVAASYGKLRDEMRVLRESMAHIDGQFEVAQAYLVKMMEAAT